MRLSSSAALLFSLTVALVPSRAEPFPPLEPQARHRVPGNLIQNSSFEQNWFNRRLAERRRFLLLQATDMGVGERDGHVDHWQFHGLQAIEALDSQVARTGLRSIRLDKPGRVSQLVRFAGEQQPRGGGAFYAYFIPMEKGLAAQLPKRPIIVGAWCRTRKVRRGAEPRLTVTIDCAQRTSYDATQPAAVSRVTQTVAFSPGTHDWEYREVHFNDVEHQNSQTLPGTPFLASVTLVSQNTEGSVWFDDVSCVEPGEAENLLPNGGFEAQADDGWPQGWSRPTLWTWFRNDYYSWTGWSHSGSKQFRGRMEVDRLLAHSGQASLRMTVLPGDNFAVEGPEVKLNQPSPRPIEVRAMVKADNLRTLEIMARDESGQWLPQSDFLGDDMEEPGAYNFGSTGCGTYDWYCVRKYFSPRKPVKSLRLVLAVRGFDGRLIDKNIVGTLWIDDVELFEHALRPTASHPFPQPSPIRDFRVVDLHLGDRLWGDNQAGMLLEFTGPAANQVGQCRLDLTLRTPSGKVRKSSGKPRVIQPPAAGQPSGYAIVEAPYQVDELCRSWEEQYRLTLRLVTPRSESQAAEFAFGTPARLLQAGTSGYYGYPEEKLVVYAHLNLSTAAVAKLTACEFVLSGPRGPQVRPVADLKRIGRPQTAPDYIDTRNLVQIPLESGDFTVHSWTDPVRDIRVAVRLRVAGGVLAESEPIELGFLERLPPPVFPARIGRTAVNERGYITVDGKPFFPVYWTPHFGICREADYPPMEHGFKAPRSDRIGLLQECLAGFGGQGEASGQDRRGQERSKILPV